MKICLILEGCYPYVFGGVSTWMHQYINKMKEHEFVLWVIGAKAENRGKFVYEFPENVTEVHEVFLDDALRMKDTGRLRHSFSDEETQSLRELMLCGRPDWEVLFRLYHDKHMNPMSFLKSEEFLQILIECCEEHYPYIAFADAFHTMRSMLLPVLYLMGTEVPKADVYHAICTGYGGLLACLGGYVNKKDVLLTEHGIYTREREEEIIRAKWVMATYKKQWISFFYMLSDIIYSRAFQVTALFTNAMRTQIQMGCDEKKCRVIENGINYERFKELPQCPPEQKEYIHIGAVLRVTPIKDVKTMIQAFGYAKKRQPQLKLWIMGPFNEDPDYAAECFRMVETMQIQDVEFTGRIQVTDYLGWMDVTILTSISEGQPLTILESYAAHVPVIATDVGNCRGLIEGEEDDFGRAGIITHIMNVGEIAEAMVYMARNPEERKAMGEAGYKRLMKRYKIEDMKQKYEEIYKECAERRNLEWEE